MITEILTAIVLVFCLVLFAGLFAWLGSKLIRADMRKRTPRPDRAESGVGKTDPGR